MVTDQSAETKGMLPGEIRVSKLYYIERSYGRDAFIACPICLWTDTTGWFRVKRVYPIDLKTDWEYVPAWQFKREVTEEELPFWELKWKSK